MIRRILVPLDSSRYTQIALQYAHFVAAPRKAQLTGLVILDIHGIEKSVGPVPLGGVYWAEQLEKQKVAEAQKHVDDLISKFHQFCTEKGIPHTEERDQGSPSEHIVDFSLYYDLVVMGHRTFFDFGSNEEEGKPVYKVMNHAITPILAVPKEFVPIRRVLRCFWPTTAA